MLTRWGNIWTSRWWQGNGLETAEAIRSLYSWQINLSYLLGKSQCGIKFWDIGDQNRLTWIVYQERWQREERSKLQCTLICQPYWERVALSVSKPLLCHLLDVHRGKKENLRRREDARKTHPRDGSLSVSNPTRALDTLSGYHKSVERKTCEMKGKKARNEKHT